MLTLFRYYLLLIEMLCLICLCNACNRDTIRVPSPSAAVHCRIRKIIIREKKERHLFFSWHDGSIFSIAEFVPGQSINKSFKYIYTASKQLIKVIIYPGLSSVQYHYNRDGQLEMLTGYQNNLQYRFSYFKDGKIKEQMVYFNKRWYQTLIYHYIQNVPVCCEVIFPGQKFIQRMSFTFDSVPNPLTGLGSVVNIFEPLYGFVPANYPYLLSRVVMAVQNEKNKKWINTDTQYVSFTINKFGYPSVINNILFIEYDCRDKQGRLLNGVINFDEGWENEQ